MKIKKIRLERDDGWTLVEAILSMIIMSVMILGLTIVLLAFREHLDRSLAVRTMDQYGNNVIERLTHKLRNAVNVVVRNGPADTNKIDIEFLDPLTLDYTIWEYWRADGNSIKVNNRRIDDYFPPLRQRVGEAYRIMKFTMTPYGVDTPNDFESAERFQRTDSFNDATWDIRFTIRYERKNISSDSQSWFYEKEYYNRVYMRNMNLIVQQGITE
jgi:type II secretory pathway pseudopilin PulG